MRESSPPAAEPVAPALHRHKRQRRRTARSRVRHFAGRGRACRHNQRSETVSRPSLFEEPEAMPARIAREKGAGVAPAAAEAGSPQDSYWDALANWNWDESEGPASRAKSEPPRSSGGPPPPRGGGHEAATTGAIVEGAKRRSGRRSESSSSQFFSAGCIRRQPAAPASPRLLRRALRRWRRFWTGCGGRAGRIQSTQNSNPPPAGLPDDALP